jgi:predicted DNA-binding transcriptional regulator YafY
MHGEEDELTIVRIKVNSYHSKYIRALPLHSSQKEIEQTNDYSIFEYHLIPTIDFKQELLSMGSNVEVLTPLKLREEMRDDILEMGELYK